MTDFGVLVVLKLVLCLILTTAVCPATGQDVYIVDEYFNTGARQPVDIDLPREIGPKGDILAATIDTSCLKYGTMVKVHEWMYRYWPDFAKVAADGGKEVCTYTLSDGQGFSVSAKIYIYIGESEIIYEIRNLYIT